MLTVFLSSLKMAVATFFSRILGLVREQFMAAYFGASGLTDAFLVAYRIPNLLRDLFAEGAFSSAFVPTFIEQNSMSRRDAQKLLWSLFILLFVITGVCSLGIFLGAEQLISVFAPTFKEDPEKFEVTVMLTKMMAPFLLFVSIAALFMGALNSLKIFFVPALAPAFFNVVMIVSMIVFPAIMTENGYPAIYSLGAGVFIGGLVQALVQIPLIIKHSLGPSFPGKILNNQSTKVLKLLGPGLIGFAATQINLLVTTILASGAAVGAVSWLSYSFRLFQLPVGILSVSIGNTNLVHFSQSLKEGRKDDAAEQLVASYFLSYFVVIPAMIVLLLLSDEIVHVIFERGKFTADSTMMTARALMWYAFGLPFYGIYKILVPSFYALDRQKVPVYCSIVAIGANIIFCVVLTPHYGFEILALGTTLSMFLNSSVQTWIMKSHLTLDWSKLFSLRWMKLWLCALVAAAAGFFLSKSFNIRDYTFLTKCMILGIEIISIFASYLITAFILGERQAVKSILRKFKK